MTTGNARAGSPSQPMSYARVIREAPAPSGARDQWNDPVGAIAPAPSATIGAEIVPTTTPAERMFRPPLALREKAEVRTRHLPAK
jgi:hypothetical protein